MKIEHKIFISQGTLEMGRNRSQKRLEAELDTKKKNHNQTPINFLKVCEYKKTLCPDNIKKYSMKCIFGKRDCQVRKYFKRFNGLDITKLGVGS